MFPPYVAPFVAPYDAAIACAAIGSPNHPRSLAMKRLFSVVLVLCLAVMAFGQNAPKPAQETKTPPAKQEGPPAKPGEAEPKPYDQVVTKDFQTQSGLFKVHTSKGK